MIHTATKTEEHMARRIARDAVAIGATTCEVSGIRCSASETTEALNDLGVADHSRGQVELAIDSYRQALGMDPCYAAARSNLGAAYYHRGEIDLAITEWEQAVMLDPALAETHHNLAVAYRRRGRLRSARDAWERAVNMDPADADSFFGLGDVLEVLGEPEMAAASYQRFAQLAPASDRPYIMIAQDRIRQLAVEISIRADNHGETESR